MSLTAIYNLKEQLNNDLPEKDALDRILFDKVVKQHLSAWGAARQPGSQEVVCAQAFVKAVLPFSCTTYNSDKANIKMVNADHVMGGCYIGYTAIESIEAKGLMDRLDACADDDGHLEQARYVQIGKFLLYRPYEGKNRVSLYRDYSRPIKALVSSTQYPLPNELTLISLKPFKDCYALTYRPSTTACEVNPVLNEQVINYSKKHATLILPFDQSIALLEEYGVKWGKPTYCFSALLRKRICRMKVSHSFYRR